MRTKQALFTQKKSSISTNGNFRQKMFPKIVRDKLNSTILLIHAMQLRRKIELINELINIWRTNEV